MCRALIRNSEMQYEAWFVLVGAYFSRCFKSHLGFVLNAPRFNLAVCNYVDVKM